MENGKEIWELERRCWIEGKSFYREIITDHSVYAFPPPMGIFKGSGFVEQMSEAGAFTDVAFTDQHIQEIGDVVVLLYEGTGKGADGNSRKSNCSSVW